MEKELRRLVKQRVRVLRGLRETEAVRSEWEIRPPNRDGEAVSALEGMAVESESESERAEVTERRKEMFRLFLEKEPELAGIFGCLCDGVVRPAEIARRLGIEEAAVARGRKRLDRRIAKFRKMQCEKA